MHKAEGLVGPWWPSSDSLRRPEHYRVPRAWTVVRCFSVIMHAWELACLNEWNNSNRGSFFSSSTLCAAIVRAKRGLQRRPTTAHMATKVVQRTHGISMKMACIRNRIVRARARPRATLASTPSGPRRSSGTKVVPGCAS